MVLFREKNRGYAPFGRTSFEWVEWYVNITIDSFFSFQVLMAFILINVFIIKRIRDVQVAFKFLPHGSCLYLFHASNDHKCIDFDQSITYELITCFNEFCKYESTKKQFYWHLIYHISLNNVLREWCPLFWKSLVHKKRNIIQIFEIASFFIYP